VHVSPLVAHPVSCRRYVGAAGAAKAQARPEHHSGACLARGRMSGARKEGVELACSMKKRTAVPLNKKSAKSIEVVMLVKIFDKVLKELKHQSYGRIFKAPPVRTRALSAAHAAPTVRSTKTAWAALPGNKRLTRLVVSVVRE